MADYGGIFSAATELLQGWNAREAGKAQSKALRKQARQAWMESNAGEQAQRRQARRAFGELRAQGAQAGLSDSVTFADVYSQSAAEAELDALNMRYQGETARQGLLFDARMVNASRPKWLEIGLSAGARAISGGSGSGYGGSYGGSSVPVVQSTPTYTRGR
jgi:hypothetical protein